MWWKRRKKILIVYDTKQYKDVIQKYLYRHGIDSDYSDIFQAVDKMSTFQPDMVLVDTECLKERGLEIVREITSAFPTPVIAVGETGESVLDALFAGASDCVPKPKINCQESMTVFIRSIVDKMNTIKGSSGLFTIFG